MPPLDDLTGERFGRLLVVSRAKNARGLTQYLCRCDCGTHHLVTRKNLTNGSTQSCGCWRREQTRQRRSKPKPQEGDRFGRLTILEHFVAEGDPKHPRVRCRCDCGTIVQPHWNNVKNGTTQSCGCIRTEELKARSITHALSESPEYRTWAGMKQRCTQPSRKDFAGYGGRGITICERWFDSFEHFYADMGPRPSTQHSIDRIDPNGNYEPGNCRWSTATTQRENQRRTKRITFEGHTGTLKDHARRVGISYTAVHQRVHLLKWTVEKALTTPLRRGAH